MLIFDLNNIGNKLHTIRKRAGLTQSQVAELAGLSERTYANAERGIDSMRIETILKICTALDITPNDILTEQALTETDLELRENALFSHLKECPQHHRKTAVELMEIYLKSINQL